MAEKKYLGKGKKRTDTWMQASITKEVLEMLLQNLQDYNGVKFVKININIVEPDKYGKDIQLTLDEWKPAS